MAETIAFREIKLEEGWLKIKPIREDLGKAMAIVRKHKDRMYDLEIREHRQKRSLDANAYAWVLIGKLAETMRIPPAEVYTRAIESIGGNYEVIPVRRTRQINSDKFGASRGWAGRVRIWDRPRFQAIGTYGHITARPPMTQGKWLR